MASGGAGSILTRSCSTGKVLTTASTAMRPTPATSIAAEVRPVVEQPSNLQLRCEPHPARSPARGLPSACRCRQRGSRRCRRRSFGPRCGRAGCRPGTAAGRDPASGRRRPAARGSHREDPRACACSRGGIARRSSGRTSSRRGWRSSPLPAPDRHARGGQVQGAAGDRPGPRCQRTSVSRNGNLMKRPPSKITLGRFTGAGSRPEARTSRVISGSLSWKRWAPESKRKPSCT